MTAAPPAPGGAMGVPSVPNLRDLGGWTTDGAGTVARGLVYRSDRLSSLDGEDLDSFAALGIRVVYDLRSDGERTADPDVLPAGTGLVELDVLAGSRSSVPADLLALLNDPPAATRALHGAAVGELFDGAYRELVTLPSAQAGYRELFRGLAAPERRPALFHCTTGKDRTGWAAAALLMLLGVSDEDVMAEYLLTNQLLVPALQPLFDRFDAAGGDHRVLLPVLGVDRAYLTTALTQMSASYGTIEGYFTAGLGLDASTIDRLRDAFTQTSPPT